MHNDFQALRKLGNCRPPEIAIDDGIYLDDLAITSQNM
jgi:hypothetical protein